MARFNGARIAFWFVRRTLGSHLRQGSPSSFISRSQLLAAGNPQTVKWRSVPSSRLFHATGTLASRDYYDVLGVSRDASKEDIRKAHKTLVKKFHPDVNKDEADAQTKFQEVQRAYEVLSDEKKRQIYDQVGHDSFEQAGPSDPFDQGFNPFGGFGDIFEDMFHPKVSNDVKVPLELSFMEAIQGCKKTVTFQTDLSCTTCNGSGFPPGTVPQTCRSCRGSGMVSVQQGYTKIQYTCEWCQGTGKIVKGFCMSCKGKKTVKGTKSVKLDVMPGVDNDETLKVYGSGGADPNGNRPGDLYVTVKVKEDPIFRREGSDIHVDAVLSIGQAMMGGTILVPTLTGDVTLKIRQGTQPGQKAVMKGKGIKTRKSAIYGNQYVHFNVKIPTNLTEKQRSLVEEFVREEPREEEDEVAVASG